MQSCKRDGPAQPLLYFLFVPIMCSDPISSTVAGTFHGRWPMPYYDRSEYVHTLSGGQLIRDTLAKKGLATGFCGGKPSAGAKTYQNVRPVDQIRGR